MIHKQQEHLTAMNLQHFEKTLTEHHAYQTPPHAPRHWLDRAAGGSDAWYYLHFLKIVYSAYFAALCNRFDRRTWRRHSLQTFLLVERCGGKLDVSGLQHVANLNQPVIYVANHMSLAETFLLPGLILLFSDVTTVVKQSLVTYPVFGRIMQRVEPIVVSRKVPRQDLKTVLDHGAECIQNGRSVLLFPQSTRSVPFNTRTFNTLGIKLARKTNAPILPVALKTDFMGIGRIFRDFGRIDRSKPVCFKFGPPHVVHNNGKDQHDEIISFISHNLKAWGGEILEK
jgi:1-acyl-sn-glycerol-3-phosphate acyltransferase